MKTVILGIILGCCVCGGKIPYHGLMLSFSERCLAKDILNLTINTIRNVKPFHLVDIIEEKGYGKFKCGQYITNINVMNPMFDQRNILDSIHYSERSNTFSMSSSENLLDFAIEFNWRIMTFSMNVAYGTGIISARSNDFRIITILPGDEHRVIGNITSQFTFSVESLDGFGANENVKKWIESKFDLNVSNSLSKEVFSKEEISQGLLKTYVSKKVSIYGKNVFYNNTPMNTSKINDYIWISFDTIIAMNEHDSYKLEKDYYINDVHPRSELGVYLSPELIIGNIELWRKVKNHSLIIDTKEIGYTGKVKDFFSARPELATRFNPETPINIECGVSNITKTKGETENITLVCNFTVKSELILATNVLMEIMFRPKHKNDTKVFITGIQESKLKEVTPIPVNMDISLFLSQLIIKYQTLKLPELTIGIPGIKYEPLRKPYSCETPESKYYYAIFYNFVA